jgi:hypothetical protein
MQKKGDVQGLMRAMGDSKPEVAQEALTALVGMGLGADLLMAAVQQKAWSFWLQVRRRLDMPVPLNYLRIEPRLYYTSYEFPNWGERLVYFSGRFVQPLLAGLIGGTAEVKSAALDGLRKLQGDLLNPPGAAALIELGKGLLQALDAQVRAGAVAILDAAHWTPQADAFGLLYWLEKRDALALVRAGADAVAPLIAALTSSLGARDWDRATTAATALGELADRRAVHSLASGINSSAGRACVEALGKISGPEADEALLGALNKEVALQGDTLAQAIQRRGPAVAVRASRMLGELGTTEAKRAVLHLCAQSGDPDALRNVAALVHDPALRADAVATLTQFGFEPGDDDASIEYSFETGDFERLVEAGEAAVPVLARRLAASAAGTRDSLICLLVRIGPPSCEGLAKCFKETRDDQLEQAVADALLDIGGDPAREVFAQLLASGAKRTRVVRALDALGFSPGKDASGAAYYEEKGEWCACLETGAPGIERIVSILLNGDNNGVSAALTGMTPELLAPVIARMEQAVLGSEEKARAAAAALGALGWKPGRDKTAAAYWAAKKEFEKCAQVGEPAFALLAARLKDAWGQDIPPLLTALGAIPNPAGIAILAKHLEAYSRQTRVAAARAIVRLYRSCALTEAQKLDVLNLRSTIAQPHTDGRGSHTDHSWHSDRTSTVSASDCNTGSFSSHTDIITRPGYGSHKDVSHHQDQGIGVDFPL